MPKPCFNTAPLGGQTNDVLLLNSVLAGQAGNYFVTVSNAIGVATSQVAVLTVFGTGGGGFEADVTPRPTGNNVVTVTDWSQIGRFIAGLDTPVNGNEFARADCAPRASLGNGRLTVSDWTQAARYAAGLEPLTPVGGPVGQTFLSAGAGDFLVPSNWLTGLESPVNWQAGKPALQGAAESPRLLRLGNSRVTQGQTATVPVELTAQGDENALGFSAVFDATRLRFAGVTVSGAAAGAFTQVNTNQAAAGRVGVVLALGAGQTFGTGTVAVANLSFASTDAIGEAPVSFADGPVTRELASLAAEVLPVNYQPGLVTAVARPRLSFPQMQAGTGWALWVTGDGGFEYVVEASTDLEHWSAVSTNRPVNGVIEVRTGGEPGATSQFYRARVRE